MSRIAIAVLTAAAFVYALWLMLRRKRPGPVYNNALHRRFVTATLVFTGLLGTTPGAGQGKETVGPEMSAQPSASSGRDIVRTLRVIWRTLESGSNAEFSRQVAAAAENGGIRRKTAKMLTRVFSELTYHKERTRPDKKSNTAAPGERAGRPKCYDMTGFEWTLRKTRENAFKQLDLLAECRRSGRIDEETAAKAHAALAREIEMMHRAGDPEVKADKLLLDKLIAEYESGKIQPGDSASVAAAVIVEMEGTSVASMTPAGRLAKMKSCVQKLFKQGAPRPQGAPDEAGSDLSAALEQAKTITQSTADANGDIPRRSREVELLQRGLYEKIVETGATAGTFGLKAAITAGEHNVDFAVEPDIRSFQKNVRRAVRLLYSRGQIPSSFVKQMERAADIEIVSLEPDSALRKDLAYYLPRLLPRPVSQEIINALIARQLMSRWPYDQPTKGRRGDTQPCTDENQKQLAEFERFIDSRYAFVLEGDAAHRITRKQIGTRDTEYRLKIRTVCRALIKAKLCSENRLKHIEKLIEIPIVGALDER
ncbi:MAG: hypothetical protein JSU94_07685 [Phycisphaerales bacterium]|nr:MAG: hypothetical protein JSU94_07685 [Phycisphaerales bacterium]